MAHRVVERFLCLRVYDVGPFGGQSSGRGLTALMDFHVESGDSSSIDHCRDVVGSENDLLPVSAMRPNNFSESEIANLAEDLKLKHAFFRSR